MSIEDVSGWLADFDDLFARVAARFGRVEPQRQARSYLLGLLSPVYRPGHPRIQPNARHYPCSGLFGVDMTQYLRLDREPRARKCAYCEIF